jgi:tetratricopeptide (TPR) repeat protein
MYYQGKYMQLLEIVDEYDKHINYSSTEDYLKINLIFCRVLELSGAYEKCISLSKEISTHPDRSLIIELAAFICETYALMRLGEFKRSNELVEFCKDKFKQIDIESDSFAKQWYGTLYHVEGSILGEIGEQQKALDVLLYSLSIRETLPYEIETASTLNNIGVTYWYLGKSMEALSYFIKSYDIDSKYDNKQKMAISLVNIGEIYQNRGELDQALKYYLESLDLKQSLGNKQSIAIGYDNIGRVYLRKNQIDIAKEYLSKSLDLHLEVGNKEKISTLCFYLILASLETNEIIEVEKYLDKLKEINAETSVKSIELKTRLAEALYLKEIGGMKNTMQAQLILEAIINDEVIEFELSFIAIINQCELFLLEYTVFNEKSVLKEIEKLFSVITSIAESNQSYLTLIESLTLESKFNLILGDLQTARKKLDQAETLANKYNLELMKQKIKITKKDMEKQVDSWSKMVNDNKETIKKMEETDIIDYLKSISKSF